MRDTTCHNCEAVLPAYVEHCAQCGAEQTRLTAPKTADVDTVDMTHSWQSDSNVPAGAKSHLWAEGTLVGGYRVTSVIGHGGMGVVYGGVNTQTNDEVAIKTVRSTKQSTINQTRRELQALRRIEHPGVVRVYDYGVHEGLPWYAMQRVHGQTLSRYIANLWGLPDIHEPDEEQDKHAARSAAVTRHTAGNGRLAECLQIIRDLASTLSLLHGEGIVHRDLKPGNVILTDDLAPIVVDFGLTVQFAVTGREILDAPENFAGTANYMSPEQCRGEFVDARADLYALGCILFEVLTGRKAFPGRGRKAITRHLFKPSPVARDRVDDLPPQVDELVEGLLSRELSDRIGSAKHLSFRLSEFCSTQTTEIRGKDFLFRPGFVGRGDRFTAIGNVIGDTVEKPVQSVFLGGESGIGKTRLAMEVAREAKINGSRILTGRCQPPSVQSGTAADAFPLHAFRSFLEYVVDACREHGQEYYAERVGENGAILAECEPEFSKLPGAADHAPPIELPAEAARFRLIDALAKTIDGFSDDIHLLFVLDDLQWADELSLSFLGLLQFGSWSLSNVAFLCTYRSDELTSGLSALLETSAADRHILLERLNQTQVAQIVADMLGLRTPEPRFAEFLSTRTNGNPFFIAEYLRAALATDILARDERGVWQIGGDRTNVDYESLALPATVGDLIAKRIELLSPHARKTLDAAAVIGRDFELDMLENVVEMEPSEIDEAVESLLFQQLLEPVDADRLQWGHDKLHDATYDKLAIEDRRVIHRKVAEALESNMEASTSAMETTAKLAVHWELAGEIQKAVQFASRTGFLANRQGASQQAIQFFTKALELDKGNASDFADAHAYWERQLGEAYMDLGQIDACKAHMANAVEHLGWPIPTQKWRLVAGLFPQLMRQTWHRITAKGGTAKSGTATADRKLEALREAANAYDRVMRMCYYTNEVPLMFYSALRNINLAERAGPCTELAIAYASMLGMASLIPIHSAARIYARNSHRVADQVADVSAKLWPLLMGGIYHSQICNWDEAAADFEAGKQLADDLGSIRRYEEFVACRTCMQTLRGDFLSAIAGAKEIHLAGARRGDVQVQCWGLLHDARCNMVVGNVDRARERLAKMRESFDWGTHYVEEIWSRQLVASIAMLDGEHDVALEHVDRAFELISLGPPIVWFLIPSYESVALTYIQLYQAATDPTRQAELKKKVDRACRTLMKSGKIIPAAATKAWRVAGMWHQTNGRENKAIKSLQKSILLAKRYNSPHEHSVTSLQWAFIERDRGKKRQLLEEAKSQLAESAPDGPDFRLACTELTKIDTK